MAAYVKYEPFVEGLDKLFDLKNHDIEALKSNENEPMPDIYIFHCQCGKQHRRFCIGGGDVRPILGVG